MPTDVVLVHGIFNGGGVFWRLKKQLENAGYRCHAPNFKPRDACTGVEVWADQLAQYVEQHTEAAQKIDLIGFSLGGIVSRYYLQRMNGWRRARCFISISAPHHGSCLAYCYPGKGAAQLRPHSAFLNELASTDELLSGIKLYSFWTPWDLMIIPPTSSVWVAAENRRFYSPLHLHMLYNRQLIKTVKSLLN